MKNLITNILMLIIGLLVGFVMCYKIHFSLVHDSDFIKSGIAEVRVLTSDQYNDILELNELLQENGFVISYDKVAFDQTTSIISYVATSNVFSGGIQYYVFDDNSNAEKFFENQKLAYEDLEVKNKSKVEIDTNSKKHSKYAISVDGEYKVVSKLGNIVICAHTNKSDKSIFNDILSDLGF